MIFGDRYSDSKLQLMKDEDQSGTREEILYTLYLADGKRHDCSRVQIKIAGEEINALVDTRCEMTIINENLYNRLRHQGLDCLELPTQHINLVNAFNTRSQRISKQALLQIIIGDTNLEEIVLLSKQLLADAILGSDFLVNNEAEISFPMRCITLRVNEQLHSFGFVEVCKMVGGNYLEQRLADQQKEEIEHMPIRPLNPLITTAVWKAGQTQPTDLPHKDVRVDRNPVNRDKASIKVQGGETWSKNKFIPQYSNYCDKDNRFFARCDELNPQIDNEVIGSMKGFQECQENDTIYRVLGNECEDNVVNEEDNTAGEDLPCLEVN